MVVPSSSALCSEPEFYDTALLPVSLCIQHAYPIKVRTSSRPEFRHGRYYRKSTRRQLSCLTSNDSSFGYNYMCLLYSHGFFFFSLLLSSPLPQHSTEVQSRLASPVSIMSLSKPTRLLHLPLEIRLMIYEELFETSSESLDDREQRLNHPLIAVCKQLRHESQPVLMSGFRLALSALARRRHSLDAYGLDISDRLAFHPLVTRQRRVRAYLPGHLRIWADFCKTHMVELVPLCGQIHIWSAYEKIGVTITPQKDASPLIGMSDPDGKSIEGLDDLTSDRLGSSISLTNWLLKRKLHKALDEWKVLCSMSPPSVDIVNQIAQQLEHIVVQAARCNKVERDRRFYYHYHLNTMNLGFPHSGLREALLADLETTWLATDKGLAA